ncbi:MAG: DsbA family protein [Alphaproteobacteria bacterium]|nr:DsbA family protein [Alphaproteobacteria bacterium]
MLSIRPLRLASLFAFVLMVFLFAAQAPRDAHAQEGLSNTQRDEVETLIQEYLRENPEVLVEAIQALRNKQEASAREQGQAAIMDFKMRLADGLNAPSMGPPDASVTVVEFFDYRCSYCKQVFPDMQALMKSDKDIRFVFMEFPILGDDSVAASNAALTVWLNWPEQYMDVHNILMGSRGALTLDKVMDLVAGVGIDPKALRDAMNSPEVDQLIKDNYELAQSMNINGTPAFIIGDELVPGAIDKATMKQLIDAARNG